MSAKAFIVKEYGDVRDVQYSNIRGIYATEDSAQNYINGLNKSERHDHGVEDYEIDGFVSVNSLLTLAAEWRADAAKLRNMAGKSQRRGDDTEADVRFAFAQESEAKAQELELLAGVSP